MFQEIMSRERRVPIFVNTSYNYDSQYELLSRVNQGNKMFSVAYAPVHFRIVNAYAFHLPFCTYILHPI